MQSGQLSFEKPEELELVERQTRGDGHDVVAVGELDKNGTSDPEVFGLAQLLERVLLTQTLKIFTSYTGNGRVIEE